MLLDWLRITEGSLEIGLKCPVRKPKLLVERPCKFIGFGTFKLVETLSLNSNELIPKWLLKIINLSKV